VLVDSVLGVFGLNVSEVSDPSSVLGGENAEFILGIGKIEDKLVILLNPLELFPTEGMGP
jgi:chemotaxis signal transduction protein